MSTSTPCPTCHGSGVAPAEKPGTNVIKDCPTCGGTGQALAEAPATKPEHPCMGCDSMDWQLNKWGHWACAFCREEYEPTQAQPKTDELDIRHHRADGRNAGGFQGVAAVLSGKPNSSRTLPERTTPRAKETV